MEKYAGTQALARAFQLIKLFTDETPVWSLVDLIDLGTSVVFECCLRLLLELPAVVLGVTVHAFAYSHSAWVCLLLESSVIIVTARQW